jgi:hypothetical protein
VSGYCCVDSILIESDNEFNDFNVGF